MRELRLLIGIFLPPIIGTILFFIYSVISDMNIASVGIIDIMTGLLKLLTVAYMFMIIPCTICSLIMEMIVKRWKENRIAYYGAASFLGWVSSLLLSINGFQSHIFIPFSVIGVLTGLLTACLLRQLHMGNPRGSFRKS